MSTPIRLKVVPACTIRDTEFIGWLNHCRSRDTCSNVMWRVANAVADFILQNILVIKNGIGDQCAEEAGVAVVVDVLAVSTAALSRFPVAVTAHLFTPLVKN